MVIIFPSFRVWLLIFFLHGTHLQTQIILVNFSCMFFWQNMSSFRCCNENCKKYSKYVWTTDILWYNDFSVLYPLPFLKSLDFIFAFLTIHEQWDKLANGYPHCLSGTLLCDNLQFRGHHCECIVRIEFFSCILLCFYILNLICHFLTPSLRSVLFFSNHAQFALVLVTRQNNLVEARYLFHLCIPFI